MPEIDIQRRENTGVPIWAWILGAILLALLIWWIVSAATPNRVAEAPQDRVAGERQEIPAQGGAEMEALPLAAMLTEPNTYFGQEVSGTATVGDVVSDRGFWVEENGQRAFVVLGEGMTEGDVNVTQGQQVSLQGTFMRGRDAQTQEMGNLEAQARRIIEEQPGFIRATSIDVLQPPDGTAGPGLSTEPGETKTPGTTTEPVAPGASDGAAGDMDSGTTPAPGSSTQPGGMGTTGTTP